MKQLYFLSFHCKVVLSFLLSSLPTPYPHNLKFLNYLQSNSNRCFCGNIILNLLWYCQNLVKNPHISLLSSAQEGPKEKYLHEVNCECFEGISYTVHGELDPPSKMPNIPWALTLQILGRQGHAAPMQGQGLYDQLYPLKD